MVADHVTVPAEAARVFCQEVFERAGLPMPGELEARRRQERLRLGFPVTRVVLDEVKTVGAEFGVQWSA